MIPILFQDQHIIVAHKPAGMLVHRGMGAEASEPFLLQTLRDQVGQILFPVHRLDRPTCGLVVFALRSEIAGVLQKSWQSGQVRKTYHAIIRGWLPQSQGLHEEALDHPETSILQEARTQYRELARCTLPWPVSRYESTRLSLIELNPLTGRWHQLRRHLSRMHHPIVGDTTHGCRHHNHLFQKQLGWWRLLLAAHKLEFPHPEGRGMLCIEDDPLRGLAPLWEHLLTLQFPNAEAILSHQALRL